MRNQRKNKGEEDLGAERSNSKKSAESAKPSVESIAENLRPETTNIPTPEKHDNISFFEVSEGGSVLVDKVNEPFDAIRKAYESRITAMTEIPKKLQEYPNPREEKIHLVVHQQKIRETQAMLEGMPQPVLRGPIPFQPSLGTIPEVPSSVERESKQVATLVVVETQIQEEENVVQELNEEQPVTTADFGDEIPEVEEIIAREMWDAVKQKMDDEALSSHTPPFSIVDFTGRPPIEAEAMPYWDDQGSEDSFLVNTPCKPCLLISEIMNQNL